MKKKNKPSVVWIVEQKYIDGSLPYLPITPVTGYVWRQFADKKADEERKLNPDFKVRVAKYRRVG
jgi:hypothetical protein